MIKDKGFIPGNKLLYSVKDLVWQFFACIGTWVENAFGDGGVKWVYI